MKKLKLVKSLPNGIRVYQRVGDDQSINVKFIEVYGNDQEPLVTLEVWADITEVMGLPEISDIKAT